MSSQIISDFRPMEMEICIASNLDENQIESLYNIINECWQHGHSYYMSNGIHRRYENIQQLKYEIKENDTFILMTQEGEITGSIQYHENYLTQNGDCEAYMGTLCILPKFNGQGLAQKLIKHTENVASQHGQSQLYIRVVHCAQPLQNYYKKLGFIETGSKIERTPEFTKNVKPEFQDQVYFDEMSKMIMTENGHFENCFKYSEIPAPKKKKSL